MGNELCNCKGDATTYLEKNLSHDGINRDTISSEKQSGRKQSIHSLSQKKKKEEFHTSLKLNLLNNKGLLQPMENQYINNGMNNRDILSLHNQDGSTYSGEVLNGVYNGFGVLVTNEYKYEGSFEDGKKSGQGLCKYFHLNKIYDGEWFNDLPNGKGVEKDENGMVYEGQFINGKKSIQGILTINKGVQYEGQFDNDMMNGRGTFKWNKHKSYKGNWLNNSFHGFGVMKDYDKRYIGNFHQGIKTGYGAYYYNNTKTSVISKWKEDKIVNGISLLIKKDETEQLLYITDGKITNTTEIENLNSINNKNELQEYKQLSDFFKEKVLSELMFLIEV